MDCPWCGSTVEICGDSWECGWCGDFGWCVDIESLQGTPTKKSANTAEITLTLSLVYHVDLPETWNDLKKALNQIDPKNALLSQLLGKVLLHNISNGIQHAGALPDEKKAEELRTFLHTTADLNLGESAEEIMRDAKRGVLFREEAALSENECGTFWAELLSTRPVEDYYNQIDPDGLFELFSELSSAYAYFGGKKDEEGEAQDYQNALEKAYNTHWQNKVLLHPDIERAKRLLAQGKFPDYEDICREILLVEYPEEVPHETAEDFDELSWESILDDVFASNTAKGIQMWRSLLNIAEPSLKTDAKTAEKLLPDWDWLDSPSHDQVLLLLTALDDERFVSQIFESASIGRLQFTIIGVCRSSGQEKLCQHLLQLALENPNLEENRKKQFRRAFSAEPYFTNAALRSYAAGKPSAYTKTDDGTVYHYCSVLVQGTQRPYAYMTGGLPLKVGDWVELPFGKDDAPRQGQVKAVMDCTRMTAPWPPERTKFVLRRTEKPAALEEPKTLPAKPVQEETPAVPIQQESVKPASFEVEPVPEAPTCTLPPLPDREVPKKPKRRIPWGWLAVGVAAAAFFVFALPPLKRSTEEQRQLVIEQQAAEQEKREREERRAEKARLEEEAAAQRRREEKQARIEELRNADLPYPGMPYEELTSTKLGKASKVTREMRSGQVCYTFVWQIRDGDYLYPVFVVTTENEEVLTAEQRNLEYWSDLALKGTIYHKPERKTGTPSQNQTNGSSGLRDEYDNPEDLYEDNRDWYEDEEEAWDEWYDD